jgi:hypothetical protein
VPELLVLMPPWPELPVPEPLVLPLPLVLPPLADVEPWAEPLLVVVSSLLQPQKRPSAHAVKESHRVFMNGSQSQTRTEVKPIRGAKLRKQPSNW